MICQQVTAVPWLFRRGSSEIIELLWAAWLLMTTIANKKAKQSLKLG
jgi:hypothetical protein